MILIQKWNKVLIKNFPALWMSGIHIIIPASIAIFVLGFFYGWSNPALNLYSLETFQLIFYFFLGIFILRIQYLRLINKIKFKILLVFYLYCILGQVAISLCVFSPNIAVGYRLNYNRGENEVLNEMNRYHQNVILFALQEDPIIESIYKKKEDYKMGDLNLPNSYIKTIYEQIVAAGETAENMEFGADLYNNDLIINKILSNYLYHHYKFPDIYYYDNLYYEDSISGLLEWNFSTYSNYLDSLFRLTSIPDVSIISSDINIIATTYGLPTTNDYPRDEILEWFKKWENPDKYDYWNLYEQFWSNKEMGRIITNSKLKHDSSYSIRIFFLFISIIMGIIFTAAILKEAILSGIVFVIFYLMYLYIRNLFFYNYNIGLESILIWILITISFISVYWYFVKEIKFVNWKLCFYIHQINFLLIAILNFNVLDSFSYFEKMDFYLMYFLFTILMVAINIIFLKIYHKLYVLPRA